MNEVVDIRQLPSGTTVVAEPVVEAASIHLGAWLRCGTRYELPADNGLSHFLEHMVFKGGRHRDARTLSRDLEAIGGQFDAYTAHEATCYTMQVLPEHLDQALDLLAELLIGGPIEPAAVATEQQVVLEEILESEDAPSDVVNELCARQAWGDHALGLPVLGTDETVGSFDAARVAAYRRGFYTADRLLLCAVGAVEPERLASVVAHRLADLPAAGSSAGLGQPQFHSGLTWKRLEVDQVHLCLGAPAFAAHDPDRYALWLLDSILGATMSSRLFQAVREERGLAYQVNSSWQAQADVGLLMIEAVAHPKRIGEVLSLIRHEVDSLLADGVTADELTWVKEYSRTTALLTFEALGARLSRVARGFLLDQRYYTLAETLAGLAAVTPDDLRRTAQRIFGDRQWVLAAVGPATERRAAAWWKVMQP